jgi:mannosyltransferase OCH1-like enzyme
MDSWERFLPDYQIMRWDENSSPINHPFVKAALKEKYFAFAADFVRFFAIQEYGGIYLDTDVLIVKDFDQLLTYDFFLGEEIPGRVNFAVFGAIPGYELTKNLLQFYNNKIFDSFDLPIISFALLDILENFKKTSPAKCFRIFDPTVFYPIPFEKKQDDYQKYIKDTTYAVHLWNHSWRSATDFIYEREYKKAFKKIFVEIVNKKSLRFNIRYYNNLFRHFRRSLKKS